MDGKAIRRRKLLDIIETNLRKLAAQYKSGQTVIILDALDALVELRHLTEQSLTSP